MDLIEHTLEIEIAAPVARVWKALTSGWKTLLGGWLKVFPETGAPPRG